jgi:hypothetical protein
MASRTKCWLSEYNLSSTMKRSESSCVQNNSPKFCSYYKSNLIIRD